MISFMNVFILLSLVNIIFQTFLEIIINFLQEIYRKKFTILADFGTTMRKARILKQFFFQIIF